MPGAGGRMAILVEIDHGMGLTTRFAHLHEISVEEGQEVRPGDPIGLLGSTGRSTGPHPALRKSGSTTSRSIP